MLLSQHAKKQLDSLQCCLCKSEEMTKLTKKCALKSLIMVSHKKWHDFFCLHLTMFCNMIRFVVVFLARLFSEFWYKSTTNSSLDQHVVCLIMYKLNLWIPISTCEFCLANFCSSLFKHDYEIFVEKKNWLQQLSHTVWLLFIFC